LGEGESLEHFHARDFASISHTKKRRCYQGNRARSLNTPVGEESGRGEKKRRRQACAVECSRTKFETPITPKRDKKSTKVPMNRG